jgi:hypothetical protein
MALCASRVSVMLCGSVRYMPRFWPVDRRYSRACSSDQKKMEFRQNASMMLGSSSFLRFIMGTKTRGAACASCTR